MATWKLSPSKKKKLYFFRLGWIVSLGRFFPHLSSQNQEVSTRLGRGSSSMCQKRKWVHFARIFQILIYLFLLWLNPWHAEIPGRGVELEVELQLQLQPMPAQLQPTPQPQPQQYQIWAASVTYTTAYSNTGYLTHWVRPEARDQTWVLIGTMLGS